MNYNHIRFILQLVSCVALVMFRLSTATAADCNKARQIYARGVQMMNFNERAKTFQEAVNYCPPFAEAHNNLADAFENLASQATDNVVRFNQLLDQAVAEYRESIKHNPNLATPYLGLGDTYRVMGLYEKSEVAYRKALEIKPGHPEALAGLEKIELIKSHDGGGFKSSNQIIEHFKMSSRSVGAGTLMGFENRTVIKDRLRFDNILFDEWSAELKRGEAVQQLEEIGKAVLSKDLSDYDFVVEGHTDNGGDYDRNLKLSWDRAEAVKTYLIAKYGIDPSRTKTQGFGYSRPKYSNDTGEHRLKNRRVELVFIEHPHEKAEQ